MCALRKGEVRTESLSEGCMEEAFSAIYWSEISFETRERRVSSFVCFIMMIIIFVVVVANQEARSPSLPPDFTFFLGCRKSTDEGRGIECFCHPQKENIPRPILGFKQTPMTAQGISLSNI